MFHNILKRNLYWSIQLLAEIGLMECAACHWMSFATTFSNNPPFVKLRLTLRNLSKILRSNRIVSLMLFRPIKWLVYSKFEIISWDWLTEYGLPLNDVLRLNSAVIYQLRNYTVHSEYWSTIIFNFDGRIPNICIYTYIYTFNVYINYVYEF